jgi:hypothetical protein
MRFLRRGGRVGHEEAFRKHLERWFGQEERDGWPAADGRLMVLRLPDQPADGVTTLITFGLSHEPLNSHAGPVREELLVTVVSSQADDALAARLGADSSILQHDRRAMLPDDVGQTGEPIGERHHVRAFWATRPIEFGDDFDEVVGTDRPFRIVRLVPLTTGEHDHALSVGGHQFGHDVEPYRADLLDMDRPTFFDPVSAPGGFQWSGLLDLDAEPDPDRVERGAIARLRPGDIAKLAFLIQPATTPGPTSERMWVEVASVDGGRLVGELTNQPVYLVDLRIGTEIAFEPRHVLDVRFASDR